MAKQLEVPGAERIADAEIRAAAESLADIREERAEHRSRTQKIEDERKEALIEVMKRKKIKTYKDSAIEAHLKETKTTTLEVKRVTPDDDTPGSHLHPVPSRSSEP